MGSIIEYYDTASTKTQAEVYAWVLARPPESMDAVAVAFDSYNALTEAELVEYMVKLRSSMTEEMWGILTE